MMFGPGSIIPFQPGGSPYGGHWTTTAQIYGSAAQQSNLGASLAGAFDAQQNALWWRYCGVAESAPEPDAIEYAGVRAGEIIAWRCWRVESGFLTSMAVDEVWYPGEPMDAVEVGDRWGQGVHAWKKPGKAVAYGKGWRYRPIIVGRVEMWGDVVEHEHGWRAEFARIISLDHCLNTPISARLRLWKLRKRYGVARRAANEELA